MIAPMALAALRDTQRLNAVEELNPSGLERVLRSHNNELPLLHIPLEDLRPMAQLIRRCGYVSADGMPNQCYRIVRKICSKERGDGWSHPVDDRAEVR
jgi:hypothetical protein